LTIFFVKLNIALLRTNLTNLEIKQNTAIEINPKQKRIVFHIVPSSLTFEKVCLHYSSFMLI